MVSWVLAASLAQSQEVLPVERVRFYETGVAYFERAGTVAGDTRLPVPRSHLDDALKTLVVLGGSEVGAIRFPSSTSDRAARVLAGFDEGGEQLAFEASLRAMQGFEVTVELAGGRGLEGLLMDVAGPIARPASTEGDPTALLSTEFSLTLLGSDGSIVRTTTAEVRAIKPKGEELARRLEQAVLSTGTGRARQGRALTVDLWEPGPLKLGYLAEAPLWRVSYRAVLGDGESAGLQAWALIHNDTDEDWEQVRVELANGRPDSFLYPMATPRYLERELVTPEHDLSPVPQLATDTPDGMWDADMSVMGSYGYGSGSGGFGARGSGSVGVVGGAPVVLGGRTAPLKEAEAVQTPTQFLYKVARPLDLPAQHSALVPVIDAEIAAEAVVAFGPGEGARNGVWLTNDTARTLPAGVLSVFEAGGLSGESGLQRMKPEEHQMVLFGNELDVELARSTEPADTGLAGLVWDPETEWLEVTERTPRTETWTVTNRSGVERAVWVGLELTVEEELEGVDRQELDPQRRWTWVPLTAGTGETEHVASVVRERGWTARPEEVLARKWRLWAEQDPDRSEVLLAAAKVADALAAISDEAMELGREREERQAELGRLREDLRAAGDAAGSGALTRRVANVEGEIRRIEAVLERVRGRKAEKVEEMRGLMVGLEQVEEVADAG